MKVIIEEKDNRIHVLVALDARKRDERMASYYTKQVYVWFKENQTDYNIKNLILTKEPKKPLHNSISKSRLSGEWVFEKVVQELKPSSKLEQSAELKEVIELVTPKKKVAPKKLEKKIESKKIISKKTSSRRTTSDILKERNEKQGKQKG